MLRLLFCLGSAFLALATEGLANERPNVLMIAIDDLNDWVGCLGGHPQAHTPNMDRLAQRGVLFTNAHCASPACNPSRAIVFSGKLPWKTGVWSNKSKKLFQQHPQTQVIPRAFQSAGYETLGTGKLMHSSGTANRLMFQHHFNPEQRWSPFTRQQVRYTEQELPSKGSKQPRHVVQVEGRAPIVLPLNRMPSDRKPKTTDGESFDWGPLDIPDSAMGDTQITDWAIEQLQSDRKGKPFFLAVGYYRPHIPLFAPARYFKRFAGVDVQLPPFAADDLDDLSHSARRWALEPITAGSHATVVQHEQWEEAVQAYLACTSFVDHQIGRLLDALDTGQYGNNTLIVLWSDHGWHLGEKQHWGKWTGWERATRVPLIIVPPQGQTQHHAQAGASCDQPVSLLDLYPTITAMCEIPTPKGLDGQSLAPLLRHPSRSTNRQVVTIFDPGNVSLRTERYRYIRYANGQEELYDMVADPNEWTNLASVPQHAPALSALRNAIPPQALKPSPANGPKASRQRAKPSRSER